MTEKRIKNARKIIQGLWETGLIFPGDRSRLLGEMEVIEEELLENGSDEEELSDKNITEILGTKTKLEGIIESLPSKRKNWDKSTVGNSLFDFLREVDIALYKIKGLSLDEESIEKWREERKKREEEKEEKQGVSILPPELSPEGGGELP